MSDAEFAYRRGLAAAFSCINRMCWFHVCEAFRLWMSKHTKLEPKMKLLAWQGIVKPDLALLTSASAKASLHPSKCSENPLG